MDKQEERKGQPGDKWRILGPAMMVGFGVVAVLLGFTEFKHAHPTTALIVPVALAAFLGGKKAGRVSALIAIAAASFVFIVVDQESLVITKVFHFLVLVLASLMLAWIIGVGKEKLDRKTAALKASEYKYGAITGTANDAIISIDSRSSIISWNAGAERSFGYRADEIMGQSVVELIPSRYREKHKEGLVRYLAGGKAHVIGKTVELMALRRDGSEFSIELSLAEWVEGGQRFFTGVLRDISERKKNEKVLSAPVRS